MAVENHGGRNRRRQFTLVAVAALLIVFGLVSAINAPAGPPRSNKADAYGGPVTPKPKNPKSVAACNKYYGATNPLADARECRAIAHKNVGLARCAKKKSAGARKACAKVVNKAFAKEMAKVAAQRKAEKACSDAYSKNIQALDPNDPDYDTKSQAISQTYTNCLKRARGA